MDYMNLSERINKHFPKPKSNRGYPPSKFTKIFILMQHEGSFHLSAYCRLFEQICEFDIIFRLTDKSNLEY